MPNILKELQDEISFTHKRQKILANNVARLNMPGQKAFDLKSTASGAHKIRLNTTSPKHIGGHDGSPKYKTIHIPDTEETTMNGNDIVLDQQLKKIADNRTDFDTAMNSYNKTISLLKLAVSGNEN